MAVLPDKRMLRLPLPARTAAKVGLAIAALLSLPAAGHTAGACPAPPAPVRDLDLSGYYRDQAKSIVDKAAEARKRAAVEPLRHYLSSVVALADRSIGSAGKARRQQSGSCAVEWLRAWADGGTYLGQMASKQAEAQRKWDLAGLALAYIKVKPMAHPSARRVIEPWLQAIADRARRIYDLPGKVRNNHWYWLGLGLGAVGLATDSPRHWDEARRIMMDAARDIGPDGLLALELKRGRRALHYHTFSVMPLVLLAELAAVRNENWYAFGDGALHRLVRVTADSLITPSRFDAAAGVRQERPIRPRAGWLHAYSARFAQRLPTGWEAVLAKSRRGDRRLGGDVLLLISRLERIRALQ